MSVDDSFESVADFLFLLDRKGVTRISIPDLKNRWRSCVARLEEGFERLLIVEDEYYARAALVGLHDFELFERDALLLDCVSEVQLQSTPGDCIALMGRSRKPLAIVGEYAIDRKVFLIPVEDLIKLEKDDAQRDAEFLRDNPENEEPE